MTDKQVSEEEYRKYDVSMVLEHCNPNSPIAIPILKEHLPSPADDSEVPPVDVPEELKKKYNNFNSEKCYLLQKIATLEGEDELDALMFEVERLEYQVSAMRNKVNGLQRAARRERVRCGGERDNEEIGEGREED